MFGLDTLRHLNRPRRAKPKRVESLDDLVEIPMLGSTADEIRAKRVATLFCDTSGFGSPHEPALTQDQFRARVGALLEEHGPLLIGIESVGQFQAFVAVWVAP